MALSTYTELQATIADYLDRPDLTNQIVDFISLAEARHRREIRNSDMVVRAQAALVAEQAPYLALPTGFLAMRNMRLLPSVEHPNDPPLPLSAVTPDQITGLRYLPTSYSMPWAYTIHEEIEFNCSPDDDYMVEMVYWSQFTPLSTTNPSNPLLLKNPDAYLYAALVAAEPFLMNDQRIMVWAELYKSAVEGIKQTMRYARHGQPIRARVFGGTP